MEGFGTSGVESHDELAGACLPLNFTPCSQHSSNSTYTGTTHGLHEGSMSPLCSLRCGGCWAVYRTPEAFQTRANGEKGVKMLI
jgi:hypothetical protein